MAERKYYWLKLKNDFFKRHDIKIIEDMPNGKDYVLFYLKLMAESVTHEGELRFSDTIPYDEKMLSVITNTNIDIVRHAIKLLKELNIIEIFDDGTLYMAEVNRMIGCEGSSAERVRKHREKQRLLQCNGDVTKRNTEIDIDIDKESEIDIDIIPETVEKKSDPKRKYGKYQHVLLRDTENEWLKEKLGSDYDRMIETMDEGIEMKGYKYKSHYLAILKWFSRDQEKEPVSWFSNEQKQKPLSRKQRTDQVIRDFVDGK